MTIWQFADDVIVIVTNILHHNHHLCHRWSPNVEVASLLSSALPQNATDFNATVAAYHETAQWVFQPKTSFHTGGTFVSTLPLPGGYCQWRLLVGADHLRQPACPQGSSFYNNPDELLDKDGWEFEFFFGRNQLQRLRSKRRSSKNLSPSQWGFSWCFLAALVVTLIWTSRRWEEAFSRSPEELANATRDASKAATSILVSHQLL